MVKREGEWEEKFIYIYFLTAINSYSLGFLINFFRYDTMNATPYTLHDEQKKIEKKLTFSKSCFLLRAEWPLG